MNATTADALARAGRAPASTQQAASTTCFHCGEALPAAAPELEIDGAARAFCCPGCAQAAGFIRELGLTDYYRLRQADAPRAGAGDTDYLAWDRADLLAEHSRELGDAREITLLTDSMRCAACAWLIDQAMRREPAVREVQANAVTGRIRLRWDPVRQPLSRLLGRLAALGYPPQLAPGHAQETARLAERRRTIMRLGVAGIGSLQAMMYAEALYLDFDQMMPLATRDFLRWIAFLVSTPVVFYAGWPFIAGMLRELGQWRDTRRLGMDTLIASSVLLAYGASLVETLRGGAYVWFDAAVMFVFLLLAARAVEQFARRRANAVVEQLSRARPALARRVDADGALETVPLAALAVGDVVQVAVGETLPADGRLLDAGEVDEALLTGESRPVARAAGDPVYAGSHCLLRPLRIVIEATGQATRLSQLVRLVEAAQDARPALVETTARLASHFVTALLVIAAVVFGVWWQIAPERAFEVALAVLVVSCPCALALAIPAGLAVAHGALARIGVLSLAPDAIDRLAIIDTVLLDKTGTLTAGTPRIVALDVFDDMTPERARRIAAALQRDSGHPLAAAFVQQGDTHAAAAAEVSAIEVVVGHGVSGVVDGGAWRLGQAAFATGRADDGAVWLGHGPAGAASAATVSRHRAVARFELADPLRADAAAAVQALRGLGIAVEIASGDGHDAVAAVARTLAIGTWQARMTPEGKLARLQALQRDGRQVAMLGDGINDAPVLAAANVSLAMASGAGLAHRAADLVLTGTQLTRLPQAILQARRCRRVLRQNLGWALGYNLLALPFAAAGLVTPWLAALGMAASSLLVTANALRLARPGGAAPAGPSEAKAKPRSGRTASATTGRPTNAVAAEAAPTDEAAAAAPVGAASAANERAGDPFAAEAAPTGAVVAAAATGGTRQ